MSITIFGQLIMLITMINNVTPRKKNLIVKVRVVSSWWHPGFGNNSPTFEVVLMDEQGGKMQASLRSTSIDQYKDIIVDGAVVSIEHFCVGANGSANNKKYLITDHPYKLLFSPATVVKKVDHFAGLLHGFKFVSFERIAAADYKQQQTVDVIGCLTSLGEKIPFQKDGQTSFRLSAYLKDLESVQIKVTVFGIYVDRLIELVSKQDPGRHIVIILQFGKINVFLGTRSVSNAFNGTRIFVNDDIAEIHDFLQRYDGQPTFNRIVYSNSQGALTGPADFYKHCDHIPLSHVTTHEKEGWYVTLATVDSIHQDEPWWCSPCKKHNRIVFPLKDPEKIDGLIGNGMKCDGCYRNPPPSLYPKFKVNVRVINDTGCVSMTLFDKHIRSLIGMSAHDLRKRHLEDGDIVPEELDHIVSQSFLFKFDVSEYNIRENYQVYTVAAYTDDQATIVSFKKAFQLYMDTLDPDDITQCHEGVSEVTTSSKDAGSVTGDNVNSQDLTNSTGDSPLGKRCSDKVDNDPGSVKSSSNKTKKRLIQVKIEKD